MGRMTSGINRCAIGCDDADPVEWVDGPDRGPKATTNVRRYSASGAIQRSGTGAMSVEKYVVTPSIRLDGMNASPIHVARRCLVREAVATSADSEGSPFSTSTGALRRHPAATARPAATTNPA